MKMRNELKRIFVSLLTVVLFISIFNPSFGYVPSNYTVMEYPATDKYTGFTMHGDLTNTTVISMRSAHLLSLDESIKNLNSSDFTGDPVLTKKNLDSDLMNVNDLVKNDSLYGVWNNLVKINSTLPTLLTTSGQQKILPLFNGMLTSIILDTAPTSPVATTEPQIQQPPLLFYIVLILLAISITIAIAFPFRISQIKKKMERRER